MPAKFARGLIKRIYEHAFERGWLEEDSAVLDPFGGIALGAWPAMRMGLTWIGIELEQKFVDLGRQNIALWNARYSRMPRWGAAALLQGDSRRLSEVVREAGICISSPPFLNQQTGGGIAAALQGKSDYPININRSPGSINQGYQSQGHHPAQLGNMREGDVGAVVSSPPYSGSRIEPGNVGNEMMRDRWGKGRLENPDKVGYGTETGQLAAMPTGEPVDACISSPPWYGSLPESGDPNYAHKFHGDQSTYGKSRYKLYNEYSYMSPEWIEERRRQSEQANLGRLPPEAKTVQTFWQAARTITEQVYQVLKPGGVAIFVLKAFVRNKAIVDFPGQWQRMCESCGFETVEIVHALLTEDRGAQYALDGELHKKTIKRSSFFRRLHERKYPHLAIDYEVVLCQQKPLE